MSMNRPQLHKATLIGISLVLASGCSMYKANREFAREQYEEAAKRYLEISKANPTNVKARMGYRRAAPLAAEQKMAKAKEFQAQGKEDQALLEVQKALLLNSNNSMALDWIAAREEQKQNELGRPEDLEAMKAELEAISVLQLNPRSIEGVNLNFAAKVSLKEIFRQLSLASGVNILFHTSFSETQVALDLRGLTFQRILDTLMLQSDHFYKVLDANTLMLFKATPQNREMYENQLIKTFFLSNAEVDGVRSVLTTLIPQLKVFPDKRLNAIVVKAKPNELAIAKRIVNQLDKPKAEVMVYLELLEVTETSLEQVGLLPVLGAADTSGIFRIGGTLDSPGNLNQNKGAIRISKSDVRILFPNLALDALKSSGDAKLVASPNVRVVSGEKGDVNIGEKITTTQSSLGGVGGVGGGLGGGGGVIPQQAQNFLAGAAQTQFGYEDVGVKISVEPRVHQNGDITLKIESAITTLKAGSSPGRPDLGRREIKTIARLRDGETVVFGGLLKEEEQKSLQGIWGLTDIPLIGKLLGNQKNTRAKTDVLLTIRTVLVRKPNFTPEDLTEFDPDLATSKAGPFTPPKPKTPKKAAPPTAETVEATAKEPETPAKEPASQPKTPEPDLPPTHGVAATPEAAEIRIASQGPLQESELVFFMTPLTEEVRIGERVRISILASGGKGVTSGSLDMRISPNVKLVGFVAGDFITADGGNVERNIGPDGAGKVTFKRVGKSSDSGTLVTLELEGVSAGNAPVMIQGGAFMAGTNPISGRFVNALVTVAK